MDFVLLTQCAMPEDYAMAIRMQKSLASGKRVAQVVNAYLIST